MDGGGRCGAGVGAYEQAMDALTERLHGVDETGLDGRQRRRTKQDTWRWGVTIQLLGYTSGEGEGLVHVRKPWVHLLTGSMMLVRLVAAKSGGIEVGGAKGGYMSEKVGRGIQGIPAEPPPLRGTSGFGWFKRDFRMAGIVTGEGSGRAWRKINLPPPAD